jgi:peptidoglycan/xylan/chitin deacetylase (PgdA/CDA1 family)
MWQSYPSYFEVFIPYVLDLLKRHDLRITFFIVGKDATLDRNKEALSLLTKNGHSVGNHSYNHEPWLHLYSKREIEWEIRETESAIEAVSGQVPRGFRGPGFSWSYTLLKVLIERAYLFDAATLPTWIGPLARFYYFRTAKLSRIERDKRDLLFGRVSDAVLRLRPYFWKISGNEPLLEIPVTTIPVVRTPFHLSYLLYLYRASPALMGAYLKSAILLCKATGTQPSFLLHPLDVLTGDLVPSLRFFPGMDLAGAQKRDVFDYVLKTLGRHYRLVDMYTHASTVLQAEMSRRA